MKVTAVFLILFVQFVFIPPREVRAATTTVNLLTTDPFAVLAGAHVIDTNISVISGNVGLSPAGWGGSPALTCAEVTGTVYSVDGSGPLSCRVTDPALLTTAKNNLTTAYGDAGGRTPFTTLAGSDNQLGGQTLTSGVYRFSHATTANLIGTLTLDAQGDPNAVFIFQAASDLITGSGSVVSLINSAQACNVFWYVPSSATFGTGSTFVGTVMADQSITDNGGSTVNGRFLASIADVTLNNTHITKPTCVVATPVPSTSSSSSGGSSSSVCTPLDSSVVAPNIIESRRVSPTSIYLSWGPYSGSNLFNVRYGPTNGNWLYNTDVTGFSTTINNLPAGRSMWFQVAARSDCAIGAYGDSKQVGGTGAPGFPNTGNPLIPGLPNTGLGPESSNVPWQVLAVVSAGLIIFYFARKIYKFSSK